MKKTYKVRHTIATRRWEGIVVLPENPIYNKPIKLMKLLVIAFLGVFFPIIMVLSGPISGGGIIGPILFVVGWELFLFTMMHTGKNGETGYEWLIPTIFYWFNKKDRFVSTKGDGDLAQVQDALQIRSVDDSGTIYFQNKWLGKAFEIDGYGSRMLFQQEQEMVIDSFERYLEQLPSNISVSFVTEYDALNLDDQVYHATVRRDRQTRSDLRALADYEQRHLSERIAKNFKTVKQWIVLIAEDEYHLKEQTEWLYAQVRNGMAREVTLAGQKDTVRLLQSFYRPS